jgi:hypothetical protein
MAYLIPGTIAKGAYNTAMRAAAGALLLLSGCSYSLEGDIREARARIRHLERQIPPESPLWIFEGPDRFEAFLQDDGDSIPEFLQRHVLRKLAGQGLPAVQGEFDWEACRQDPAAFRGKAWRIGGLVGDLRPEPVAGLPAATSGALFDEGRRVVLFQVAEKPEVLVLREDSVTLAGIFVQWIEYGSRSGARVTAPLFLGKSLRRTL